MFSKAFFVVVAAVAMHLIKKILYGEKKCEPQVAIFFALHVGKKIVSTSLCARSNFAENFGRELDS